MATDNLVGQTLGQYELRELLGSGGMGSVYRAFQTSLKRAVAIKVLSSNLAAKADYSERFNREAEIAAALEHPNIVPIVDYGTHGKISYVVMRLLTGGALNDRMRERIDHRGTPPSLNEIAHLLSQLASALDYAHSHGVIHRDIKPSNVMFDNHGNAYMVDFGIAKILEGSSNITGTGATMGTPAYMSPEQWKSEPLTPSADQYSLAVLAYELLTGRVPFEAPTPYALMNKHLHEKATPAKAFRSDIPEAINLVLERAMSKEPEKRFHSVTAFAQAFEAAVPATKSQDTGFFTYQLRAIHAADVDDEGSTKISGRQLIRRDNKMWFLPVGIVIGLLVIAVIAGLNMAGRDENQAANSDSSTEVSDLPLTETPATILPTADPVLASSQGVRVAFEDEFNDPGNAASIWSITNAFPIQDGKGVLEESAIQRYLTSANGFVTLFRTTPGTMRISLNGGPGPSFWSFALQQTGDNLWEFELSEGGEAAPVGNLELAEGVWYYYLVRMVGGDSLQVQLWQRDQPDQFIINETFENDLIVDTYIFHATMEATEGTLEIGMYKELAFEDAYTLPENPPIAPLLLVGTAGISGYSSPNTASAERIGFAGNSLALLGITRDGGWYLASDGNEPLWIPHADLITVVENPFLHIPTVQEIVAETAPLLFPAGVQVLLHEDFENADGLSSWDVTPPENIEITDGQATIKGGDGNTELRRDTLIANQGFLVLFQYEPGDIEISFFSNTEAEGNFYGYSFHNNVRNFWQLMRRHTGTNYFGDYELEPGKWYYLLMRADQQSGGSIQLWEQGQQDYLVNQFIEGDGIQRRWTSFFSVAPDSTLILEAYTDLAFPLDYETPAMPPSEP